MSLLSRLTACSVCIAFGITLPMAFHLVGATGPVFLPMHIPVLISGLLLGAKAGFITGVITPLLSSVMTGMPPVMPILPIMVVELSIYGFGGGWLYRKRGLPLLAALVVSMLFGRLAAAMTVYVLSLTLSVKLQPLVYITGALVTGLPGIIIQILFIPLLVKRLQAILPNYTRSGQRYECQKTFAR